MDDFLKIYGTQADGPAAGAALSARRDLPPPGTNPEGPLAIGVSAGQHVILAGGVNIVVSPYFRWKRIFDIPLAGLMLIPALPVIGLLVMMVRLTSRGPGIYRQLRVGKNGRIFTMFKIRSMRQDAEAGRGAVWSQDNDPRSTRLGQILRKLHLDELPQLYNVLRGEMSLVGPRPERPQFVTVLAAQIDGYYDRLTVEPGITGLAQINLPPDTDVNCVRRKLFLDREYIHSADWFFDLRIVLCTAGRMLRISQPTLLRVLGLRRKVPAQVISSPATIEDRRGEPPELHGRRAA